MSQPRKILTVFYKHRRGGHCKRLYMMIEALLDAGFEVHYLAMEPLKVASHKHLVAHILRLPVRKSKGAWFWFCFSVVAPFALLKISLTERVSAIAVFDTYYAVLSKLAALFSRIPLLLFLRSVPWRVNQIIVPSFIRRMFSYGIDVLGLHFSQAIVSVTTTMQEEICSKFPSLTKRLITLPNSVIYPSEISGGNEGKVDRVVWHNWIEQFPVRKRGVAASHRLSEKNIILCTSGELNIRKNVEHLVRAIGAHGGEKLSLIICGDGPERARILSVINGYGLGTQVVLPGWVENPLEIVSGCDLFVMTSRHEGMSNSMLEALGAGAAVIAADTPEMREVLHYDDLLFNAAHVGELSRRLETITTKKGELNRIRELSHERARHFSFDWGREVVNFIEKQMP